jgi:integrase
MVVVLLLLVMINDGGVARMRVLGSRSTTFNCPLKTTQTSHVRQSAKRAKIPVVLTVEEIAALLRLLREPARTAVFLDELTGLRVGELLALKWNDIDFDKSQISVTRSIAMQRIGDCKTEASRKPVPLDLRLAEALYNWHLASPYPLSEDWVFASPHSNGRFPY